MRRTLLITLTTVALSLFAAASAGAVVIDMGASGRYGVALVPGSRANLTANAITTVTAPAPCTDPWLPPDFILHDTGLCYHGGPVLHKNETFAVSWDPHRFDWQATRNYIEQFQSNVASGSAARTGVAQRTSPYALTSQYRDAAGRATYDSLYGGGCIDFGQPGGSSCKFASAVATGPGHNDAGSDCPVGGFNDFYQFPDSTFGPNPNQYCITDDQIRSEVSTMVSEMGLVGRTQSGYTPLIVIRTPAGVVDCLDAAGKVCSANGSSPVPFCSYHAQTSVVGGGIVNYVVQPWTASGLWHNFGCDDPGPEDWKNPIEVDLLATGVGARLVSPLSQAELDAITDPALNGWYALDGSEMSDNGCLPQARPLDGATVGTGSYFLQREANNGGSIVSDPNVPGCAGLVNLVPTFVVPSPIDAGDVVAFDGSVTESTLLIPQAGYSWSFGDGTSRTGASVVHQFAKGGNYTVTLTVTDRGGNKASFAQQVTVNGSGGTPPPPHHTSKFQARLALIPQGFKTLLRSGIALKVTSNEVAAGLTQITISRRDAKRAHLRTGRSSTVTIGRGTISGIKNGTIKLHLRLSRDMTKKLGRLKHVKLTVRLTLRGKTGDRASAVAAGSY